MSVDTLVSSDTWSCRAGVASGFAARLIGLRRAPSGESMLFRTNSVHGFGMRRELLAVGIDRELRVIGTRVLRPNRMVGFRGARWVLEMPSGSTAPSVGEQVRIDV